MLEKIEVQQDPNVAYDPYFYERKEQLDKTIEAVDDGSMMMYDSQEWDVEMKSLDAELDAFKES